MARARAPSITSVLSVSPARPTKKSKVETWLHPAFDSEDEELKVMENIGTPQPVRRTPVAGYVASNSSSSRSMQAHSPPSGVQRLPLSQKSNPELKRRLLRERSMSIYDGFEMVTPAPAGFMSTKYNSGSRSAGPGSPYSLDAVFNITGSSSLDSPTPTFNARSPTSTHKANASLSSDSDIIRTPATSHSKFAINSSSRVHASKSSISSVNSHFTSHNRGISHQSSAPQSNNTGEVSTRDPLFLRVNSSDSTGLEPISSIRRWPTFSTVPTTPISPAYDVSPNFFSIDSTYLHPISSPTPSSTFTIDPILPLDHPTHSPTFPIADPNLPASNSRLLASRVVVATPSISKTLPPLPLLPSRSGSFAASIVVSDISPNASRQDPAGWRPQIKHSKTPSHSTSLSSINIVAASPDPVNFDFARNLRRAPFPPSQSLTSLPTLPNSARFGNLSKRSNHSLSTNLIPSAQKKPKKTLLYWLRSLFRPKKTKATSNTVTTAIGSAQTHIGPDSGSVAVPMQTSLRQPLVVTASPNQPISRSHIREPHQPVLERVTAVTTQLQNELRMPRSSLYENRNMRSIQQVINLLHNLNAQVGETCQHICDELWNSISGVENAGQKARVQEKSMIKEIEKDVRSRLNKVLVDYVFTPFSIALSVEDDLALRAAHRNLAENYDQPVSARWRVIACSTTAAHDKELQGLIHQLASAHILGLFPDLRSFSLLAASKKSDKTRQRLVYILVPLLLQAHALATILHQEMITAEFEVITGSPLGFNVNCDREEEVSEVVLGGIVVCHWALGLESWRGKGAGGCRQTLVRAKVVTDPAHSKS